MKYRVEAIRVDQLAARLEALHAEGWALVVILPVQVAAGSPIAGAQPVPAVFVLLGRTDLAGA